MARALDHLQAEIFSPLGAQPVVLMDAGSPRALDHGDTQGLVIGIDRDAALPAIDAHLYDVLLTSAPNAPRPWVSAPNVDELASKLCAAVHHRPHAATALRQVLRLNETLPFEQALIVESLAYSTLLGGAEFAQWRQDHPPQELTTIGRVDYARDDDHVTLTLAAPETHNAMSAPMRDALFEALASVLDDPSAPTVTIQADGPCFSTGGDLNEFGANRDLAAAHAIRIARSAARLIDELGDRVTVRFHGVCIGSGLEAFVAAARRVAATEHTSFQLPELGMGLIPGAGGTVTVPRAIGRHRACAMMLGGARLSAKKALDWGLIQAIGWP